MFIAASKDKKFVCESCGKKYKTKSLLGRHVRYECGTEPQFPCPLCLHRAKHKQALQYHAIARHNTRLWEPVAKNVYL